MLQTWPAAVLEEFYLWILCDFCLLPAQFCDAAYSYRCGNLEAKCKSPWKVVIFTEIEKLFSAENSRAGQMKVISQLMHSL